MADRDDDNRGYGRPSGRYDERGHQERGERDRGQDDWHSGSSGRDHDRGFIERAGEQVRSWFSDDDDNDHRGGDRSRRDDGQERSRRHQQERGQGGYSAGGMMSGQGRRGNYDRDDRPPQTMRGEPTSGGYDYRQDRWQGASPSARPQDQVYGTGHFGNGGEATGGTRGYRGDNRAYGRSQGSHPHDDHYQEWRQQQMSELDRDYDEYRREHRDKFHSEFSSWRGQRQQQRQSMRQVTEHMEVMGSDGQPVGTVDKVSGDRIILTKNGPMAGGHHHSIPCSWIQSVDERVTINKTADQARQQWTDEENRRALFESDDQRQDDGPHILDRSFSGTYEGPR